MNKKIICHITIVILSIICIFNVTYNNVYANSEVVAPAKAMVVLEGNTGDVLDEFK